MAKKGIDAEIDKVLRIMEANPDGPTEVAANLLNQARISGDGPLRQKYLRKAQKVIAQIDPHADPEKLQELQAEVLALQGRGGDTEIAHTTPGEIVIPARLRTPEVMAAVARAAQQAGIDPRRLVVGSGRNAVNPRTGQKEFADPLPPLQSLAGFQPILESERPYTAADANATQSGLDREVDRRGRVIYQETSAFRPQLINPSGGYDDRNNWDPKSAQSLHDARAQIGAMYGTVNPRMAPPRPFPDSDPASIAQRDLAHAAARDSLGTPVAPYLTNMGMHQGDKPMTNAIQGWKKNDGILFDPYGPFNQTSPGGAIPTGPEGYIDFWNVPPAKAPPRKR